MCRNPNHMPQSVRIKSYPIIGYLSKSPGTARRHQSEKVNANKIKNVLKTNPIMAQRRKIQFFRRCWSRPVYCTVQVKCVCWICELVRGLS